MKVYRKVYRSVINLYSCNPPGINWMCICGNCKNFVHKVDTVAQKLIKNKRYHIKASPESEKKYSVCDKKND